jgi:hypothetical protein
MTALDLIEHRQVRQGPTLERPAEAEPDGSRLIRG